MSAAEACRILGLTYRRLDFWARTGLLPDAARAPGSGAPRRFTIRDLERAAAIKVLVDAGVDAARLATAIRSGMTSRMLERVAGALEAVEAVDPSQGLSLRAGAA